MASRDDRTKPRRPDPRLYLVSPEVAEADGFAGTLAAALAGAGVAAVLLRLAASDERSLINIGKKLAPLVEEFRRPLEWLPGCPLDAEGRVAERYG